MDSGARSVLKPPRRSNANLPDPKLPQGLAAARQTLSAGSAGRGPLREAPTAPGGGYLGARPVLNR